MSHIFISYSRKNEKQVTDFVENLRKLGIEVWQDISEKRSGIPYSTKWFRVIEEAIFTASGAIIFNTDTWKSSNPCQRELELIQNTDLPFLYVFTDETKSQVTVTKAASWCREQISSPENGYCEWMRAGAYRVYRGLPIGKMSFYKTWKWLKKCHKVLPDKKFRGDWLESLRLFLKKVKRNFFWGMAIRIAVLVFLASIRPFTTVVKDVSEMEGILVNSISVESAYINKIRRIGEYDPVLAVQLLEEYKLAAKEYKDELWSYGNERNAYHNQAETLAELVSLDYYKHNRILLDLITRNFPVAFYDSVSKCSEVLKKEDENRASSQFTVTLSHDTAQVFIYDKERYITRQLLLAAVPETYCFSKEGNELIIAAANKVYVYNLYGDALPSLLSYNRENIRELFMCNNQIYAVTENDHVVVWDNPLQERKINRRKVSSGYMTQLQDGRIMAVYVDDDDLVINTDNEEKSYPLPFKGSVDKNNIAVSSDCAYAAVSYEKEGSKNDMIGVIKLSNGSLVGEYDTGGNIVGFIFTKDGDFLVAARYDECRIEYIDLETGEIRKSTEENDGNPYTIIEYKSKFLVSDVFGGLTIYDGELNQIGSRRAIGNGVPVKQFAVSAKYDCILTAGRGGNMPGDNVATWLSSDEQFFLLPVEKEPMISTTAVATDSIGEYAAYGNAGGSIYLWDIKSRYQIWNIHSIPDSIVMMLFSEDLSSLYVLGSSGTIYEINITDILPEIVPVQDELLWDIYMERADKIRKDMYKLGLSLNE